MDVSEGEEWWEGSVEWVGMGVVMEDLMEVWMGEDMTVVWGEVVMMVVPMVEAVARAEARMEERMAATEERMVARVGVARVEAPEGKGEGKVDVVAKEVEETLVDVEVKEVVSSCRYFRPNSDPSRKTRRRFP